MFDLDVSEFTKCVCENAEKQYESYTEADKVLSDDKQFIRRGFYGSKEIVSVEDDLEIGL